MTNLPIPDKNIPGLTYRQTHLFPVLKMIDDFSTRKHYQPSYRDIGDAFPHPQTKRRASTNSAYRWLLDMVEMGWIETVQGVCRSTTITECGYQVLAEAKD